MRFLLALAIAVSASLPPSKSFSDDFARTDALSPPNYLELEGAPPLVVAASHRVCSSDHGFAFASMAFPPRIAANVTFIANDVQGQECYALFSTGSMSPMDGSESSPLLFAGCDGGGGGKCIPTIWLLNNSTKARAKPILLQLGVAVRLNVAVAPSSGGDLSVLLRVVDDASGALLASVDSVVTVGAPLTHAGFLVGRGSGKPTCVTKLDVTSNGPPHA